MFSLRESPRLSAARPMPWGKEVRVNDPLVSVEVGLGLHQAKSQRGFTDGPLATSAVGCPTGACPARASGYRGPAPRTRCAATVVPC